MDNRFGRRVAAVALSAGVVAALAATAGASAAPATQPAGPAATTVEVGSPGVLHAMEREFDLSTEEARERLTREHEAARATERSPTSSGRRSPGPG